MTSPIESKDSSIVSYIHHLMARNRLDNNLSGALRVLAMLESVSLRADCMFYTTLICACAKAGKVDLVFQVWLRQTYSL